MRDFARMLILTTLLLVGCGNEKLETELGAVKAQLEECQSSAETELGAARTQLGECWSSVEETSEALNASTKAIDECRKNLETAVLNIKTCKANLQSLRTEADGVAQELAQAKEATDGLKKEVEDLKRTASYEFASATEAMQSSKDDAGDQKAIALFQAVASKYPNDPLAATAQERIEELKAKIQQRAEALVKAQKEVKKQIAICKKESARSRKIEENGMVFNQWGKLNMNVAMRASRRSRPHEKKAKQAKTRAWELLKIVPDPDGSLEEAVSRCSSEEY